MDLFFLAKNASTGGTKIFGWNIVSDQPYGGVLCISIKNFLEGSFCEIWAGFYPGPWIWDCVDGLEMPLSALLFTLMVGVVSGGRFPWRGFFVPYQAKKRG